MQRERVEHGSAAVARRGPSRGDSMSQGMAKRATYWVVLLVGAIVACATLLLAVSSASQAASTQAASTPTLQFNCDYLKGAAIDPIIDPPHAHDHDFYGNMGVAADSTYESLVANKRTTCNIAAGTASYWHPAFRDGGKVQTPLAITNYYRDTGERSPNMKPIPEGLQNIATLDNGNVKYRCGKGSATNAPPVGCTTDWRVMFQFPNCWNPKAGKGPDSVLFSSRNCPSSHPYEFPAHQMAVKFPRPADGRVDAPVEVSAGEGEWRLATEFAHADRFNADQASEFDNKWMGPCVLDVPAGGSSPGFCTNASD